MTACTSISSLSNTTRRLFQPRSSRTKQLWNKISFLVLEIKISSTLRKKSLPLQKPPSSVSQGWVKNTKCESRA